MLEIGAVVVLFVVLMILQGQDEPLPDDETWAKTLAALGLHVLRESDTETVFAGSVGDLGVRVVETFESDPDGERSRWYTTVSASGTFSLSAKNRFLRKTRVPTGDRTFDREVRACAVDELVALATLDASTRQSLLSALYAGATVTTVEIALRCGGRVRDYDHLAHEIERVVDLGLRLRAPELAVAIERLFSMMTTDPVPAVRRRCLEAILDDARTSEVTRQAALSQAIQS